VAASWAGSSTCSAEMGTKPLCVDCHACVAMQSGWQRTPQQLHYQAMRGPLGKHAP
jgi:hypothetical protein